MKAIYLLLFILLFCLSSALSQTSVAIPAAADNTMYESAPNNSNALGQNIFSGTNNGGSPRRGLIKFDIAAAIPSGATITSVTLTLNCNLSRTIADNVSLHKVVAGWGEGTSNAGASADGGGAAATTNDATWTARFFPGSLWTNPGGDYNAVASATTSINSTGFFQWSAAGMVADVQNWLTAPASNFGWILICDETTFSTARKFGSRENTTVANRPSLSVTYTTSLPVTLVYFKASVHNKSVALRWETSQEINNYYFEVMHSTDGIAFTPVGKLEGHGTTSTKHQYSFVHNTNTAGHHFYKLAQVDFDGKRKYSAIEKVFIVINSGDVYLFPNPVLREFRISLNNNLQNTTYKIINQSGAVLLSGRVASESIKAWTLLPGTYYLCIYIKNELVSTVVFFKM